jgi:predicted esterase YcpF (UPF0227 family)
LKIIYLHGFNSSSKSTKAQILECYFQAREDISFICPDLKVSPNTAIEQIENLIKSCKSNVALIGSSLGGLYATYASERFNLKSVVINPVVSSHLNEMSGLVGQHTNFHTGEKYFFSNKNFSELKKLALNNLRHPLNHLCLIKLGDEVLDHKKTLKYFSNSLVITENEGNHSFEDFSEKISLINDFLF